MYVGDLLEVGVEIGFGVYCCDVSRLVWGDFELGILWEGGWENCFGGGGKLLPDPTEPGNRRRHTSEMVLVLGLVRHGLVLSRLWTWPQGPGLHWCLNSLLTGLSALGVVILSI